MIRRALEIRTGRELAGEVDGPHPRVIVRSASRVVFLPEHPVGHRPVDQRADQVLAKVIDVADRIQELPAGAFPDQRIGVHAHSLTVEWRGTLLMEVERAEDATGA